MRHCNSTLIHRLGLRANINRLFTMLCIVLFSAISGQQLNAQETSTETGAEAGTNNGAEATSQRLSPENTQMTELAALLEPADLLWLGEAEQRFISLYRPALTPSQMALVLLPDSPYKLSQHNFMTALYHQLPEHGWSTLNIAIPEITIPAPQFNASANSPADESGAADASAEASTEGNAGDDAENNQNEDAGKPKANRAETTLSRIDLSTAFLKSNDIKAAALVAENHSGQLAIAAAIAQKDFASGLVLWKVDAEQLDKDQLKQLLDSRITILDIVDYQISAAEKAQRIRLFKMAGFNDDYRLIVSPAGRAGIAHSQQRVRHWLETSFQKY